MRLAILILLIAGVASAQSTGLGHSFLTNVGPCLDVDGDGYGVGAGCLGPDADDTDATVWTTAQVVAKYGSINAFLIHIGVQSSASPLPVYCVSNTGNDSNGSNTNADTACASPLQTWYPGVYTKLNPAAVPAIVLFRGAAGGGTGVFSGTGFGPGISGTSSAQLTIMGYPGEFPTLDCSGISGDCLDATFQSYVTYRNLRAKGNNGGDTFHTGGHANYPSVPTQSCHVNIYYLELSGGGSDSNAHGDDLCNLEAKYNVLHDPSTAGQHNLYYGSTGTTSTNVVISDNIMYNVFTGGFPNLQFNGRCSGCYIENNWLYNADQVEISIFNGMTNSFIRNNVAWNTGTTVSGGGGEAESLILVEQNTSANCHQTGTPDICPWNITGNVIANNTFWSGKYDIDNGTQDLVGSSIVISNITVGYCSPCGTASGNTFSNNIVVGVGNGSPGYTAVQYGLTGAGSILTAVGADTYTNNLVSRQDGNTTVLFGANDSSINDTYSCSTWPALSNTGCNTANPLFVDANVNYWGTPWLFQLAPCTQNNALCSSTDSPALLSGSGLNQIWNDIYGMNRPFPPAIGAIEPIQGTPDYGNVHDLGSSTQTGPVCYPKQGTGAGSDFDNYDFPSICPQMYPQWGSCGYDFKRHRLECTGGGHPLGSAYAGNDIVALKNPQLLSSATMTRPTNPSPWSIPSGGAGAPAISSDKYSCYTTLAAAITSTGATTMTVNTPGANNGCPNPPFQVQIDTGGSAEIVNVTATPSNTWTITRNPSPFTHLINAPVGGFGINSSRGTSLSAGCFADSGGNCYINSDNTPVARHEYYGVQYLPTQDALFSIGDGYPNGSNSPFTWHLNFTGAGSPATSQGTATWQLFNPPANFDPQTGNGWGPCSGGEDSVYDSVDDLVYVMCESGTPSAMLAQWTPSTGSYTMINRFAWFNVNGGGAKGFDPINKLIWNIGSNNANNAFVASYINPATCAAAFPSNCDMTVSTTGCTSLWSTAMYWQGMDWDYVTQQFVIWPNGANTVIYFNTSTYTCTSKTLGGLTIPSSGSSPAGSGALGRWRYLPDLTGSVVLNGLNLGSGFGASDAVVFGVDPVLVVSPALLPSGNTGSSYSQTLTPAGGKSTYTFAAVNGSIPGLSLSSGGVLSGTPSTPGTYPLVFSLTDSASNTALFTRTVTVSGAALTPASAWGGNSTVKGPVVIKPND